MSASISIDKEKSAVARRVEALRPQLTHLAIKIHDNPEPGFKEFKASRWLTAFLENKRFAVERGICDMPTAFSACYGKGAPRVALLAEYDALPGVGHGCGHNLICTIAAGAAVASRKTVDAYGGSVIVIGTPAEELHGGKVTMAERGAFGDIDAALLVHPETFDAATSNALACQNLTVEFFGKAAHAAAAPERGINALDAMILSYNAIAALRQHMRSTARVHGVITHGGDAPNVVPEHSAAEFIVRAADDAYLDELEQKVLNCFAGAAKATGARLEYKWDDIRYATMRSNMTLAKLYADNMKTLGREARIPAAGPGFGSTDMGNVSRVTPAIHAMVAIAPRGVGIHSPDFARAAVSEAAFKGMTDAAKAVAMTIIDLLGSPDKLRQVKEEFNRVP